MENNKWGNKKAKGWRGVMSNIPIHALLDLQYLKRWHMVGSTIEDTVASHSFRVAMIAISIAEKYWSLKHKGEPLPPEVRNEVAYYSVMHDACETFYGDIATHTKDKVKNKCPGFLEEFDGYKEEPSLNNVELIIKLADMVDGLMFISVHGIGDRAYEAVEFQTVKLHEKFETLELQLKQCVLSTISEIRSRQNGPEKPRIRF